MAYDRALLRIYHCNTTKMRPVSLAPRTSCSTASPSSHDLDNDAFRWLKDPTRKGRRQVEGEEKPGRDEGLPCEDE